MVWVVGKNLIATIQVKLCCLIPASLGLSEKLLLLKFSPLAYTITAISWPPPLISQLFHSSQFEQGRIYLYSQAVFECIAFIL